jgi:hypothetical protein
VPRPASPAPPPGGGRLGVELLPERVRVGDPFSSTTSTVRHSVSAVAFRTVRRRTLRCSPAAFSRRRSP